ncbi:DUF427 domain-containing protein [Candidatus Uhrbacteria bacterium]|nr:DUF427 domain-containing protein [Candidatus Uhrbacteria bacterium]
MKAIYKNTVIAESDDTIVVENNHYFPPDAVKMEYLQKSPTPYTCPWKGKCQYFNVVVDGETLPDTAWSYPDPKEAAAKIKGYIAFWKDVKVL